jgi:hypothetical protein
MNRNRAQYDQVDRCIHANWGKVPVITIASLAGVSRAYIYARGEVLGMPPPSRGSYILPRGYSKDEMAWAKENAATDREARMMLALTGRDVRNPA